MSPMMYNYNPMFPASPIFCSPLSMLPVPVSQQMVAPEPLLPAAASSNANCATQDGHKPSTLSAQSTPMFQRPASQATSVKAEPGSAMGSIASASVANKVNIIRHAGFRCKFLFFLSFLCITVCIAAILAHSQFAHSLQMQFSRQCRNAREKI